MEVEQGSGKWLSAVGLFTSTIIRKNGDACRRGKRHSCVMAGACGQQWRKFRLFAVCSLTVTKVPEGSCDENPGVSGTVLGIGREDTVRLRYGLLERVS